MKQALIRKGQILLANVPAPLVEPGHELVEVAYSLISTGTDSDRLGRDVKRSILVGCAMYHSP